MNSSSMTQVAPKVLHEMKIVDLSVHDSIFTLSQKHTIVLVFLRHLNCCFCKEALLLLHKLQSSMLQINCLPIVVHQEPAWYMKSYLQKNKLHLLHVEDNGSLSKQFGIPEFATSAASIVQLLPRVFQMYRKYGFSNSMQVPKDFEARVNVLQMPGMFLVQNGKIKYQHVYTLPSDRYEKHIFILT